MLEQVLIPDCTEMFCCLESGLKMFEFLLHFWVCLVAKLFRGRNEDMWYGWVIFVHYSTALAANGFGMGETGSHQLWEGSDLAAGAQCPYRNFSNLSYHTA